MGMITVDRPEAGIAVVTLDRPAALNALTVEMMKAFHAALDAIEGDPAVRVVILSGRGRAFCAGLDLKHAVLGKADGEVDAVPAMALQELFGNTPARIRRMPQPFIGVVHGVAVGAGFALGLACDIRIVEPTARFLVGAVKIGLSAGETGISYHLPRIIGAGRAFEVMLTGREIGSDEALATGLASIRADAGGGLSTAIETARTICANSPYAVKHTKQLMWSNLDAPSLEAAVQLENHAQVVALLTEDFAEARDAFAQKRAPVFRGA